MQSQDGACVEGTACAWRISQSNWLGASVRGLSVGHVFILYLAVAHAV